MSAKQSSFHRGPNKQTLATTSLMSVGNHLVANDGQRHNNVMWDWQYSVEYSHTPQNIVNPT